MPKKKTSKRGYEPPALEKYDIRELTKDWDLEVVGEVTSCSSPD